MLEILGAPARPLSASLVFLIFPVARSMLVGGGGIMKTETSIVVLLPLLFISCLRR
jgi:hypothetical protein